MPSLFSVRSRVNASFLFAPPESATSHVSGDGKVPSLAAFQKLCGPFGGICWCRPLRKRLLKQVFSAITLIHVEEPNA